MDRIRVAFELLVQGCEAFLRLGTVRGDVTREIGNVTREIGDVTREVGRVTLNRRQLRVERGEVGLCLRAVGVHLSVESASSPRSWTIA